MVNPHVQAANIGKYDYKVVFGDYYATQATLALTYSQDTANLIAWRTSGQCYVSELERVDAEIRNRLGLDSL